MDVVALEAVAAAGCTALAIASRRRVVTRPRQRPTFPSARRLIRTLPHRHRRTARSIAALASDCLARHPQGSFENYTAAETLRTYLPETISAFLSVPAGYRRERRAGKPSADDELRRQFDTLYHGLVRIAQADAAAGSSRMSANGVFLEERFGPVPTPPPLTAIQALRRELTNAFTDHLSDFIRR